MYRNIINGEEKTKQTTKKNYHMMKITAHDFFVQLIIYIESK